MNTLGIDSNKFFVLLSCEHYTNYIPQEYRYLFQNKESILNTHSGWDIGMHETISYIEQELEMKTHKATTSRLLVDLNRSLGHPNLYSAFTKSLSKIEKSHILTQYYIPYRENIEKIIMENIKNKTVFHIALHSFTPILNGEVRSADIGLLYDPKSSKESTFAKIFKYKIKSSHDTCKVRFNYPYLGVADSFPTYLRKKFGFKYAGIELEINQKLFTQEGKILPTGKRLTQAMAKCLKIILL